MPIRHCIVHLIDKKPDGSPAVLHARDSELATSQAMENLLADLNESYNAKQGKAWGLFHEESGAYPFSGWLSTYLEGEQGVFTETREGFEVDGLEVKARLVFGAAWIDYRGAYKNPGN